MDIVSRKLTVDIIGTSRVNACMLISKAWANYEKKNSCEEAMSRVQTTLGCFCFLYESLMSLTFIPFPSLQYVKDEIQDVFKTV